MPLMHFVDQWNEQFGVELQDFPRKTLVPKVEHNEGTAPEDEK